MQGLTHEVLLAWQQTGWLELLAMALALAYVVLAIPQHVSCWYAAFTSSVLYAIVLFDARLYMEAALNVFYAAMAIYGYWQWRGGRAGAGSRIVRWPWQRHVPALVAILAVSACSGLILRRYTPAASPFVDSMVTWSSVFATFLVARKVYENWHWWLVIDSAAMCLYVSRHLYATALLFLLYVLLIIVGMREWRRSLPLIPGAAIAGGA